MVDSINNTIGLPWHIAAHGYHADVHKDPVRDVEEEQPLVSAVASVDKSDVDTGHSGRERERSQVNVELTQDWIKRQNKQGSPVVQSSAGRAIDLYRTVSSFKPKNS